MGDSNLLAVIPGGSFLGFMLVGFLLSIPLGGPPWVMLVMIIGWLGVLLWLLPRFALTPVVCTDPRRGTPGVLKSIEIGWRATSPVIGRYLLFLFLCGLTAVGTALLLLVGLIFLGLPLAIGLQGAAYSMIVRR